MSQQGMRAFADVLSVMQETRGTLLRGDNQDIRLGQLLDDAKEHVKERFAQETLVDKPESEERR
jgi:hypothetical protein